MLRGSWRSWRDTNGATLRPGRLPSFLGVFLLVIGLATPVGMAPTPPREFTCPRKIPVTVALDAGWRSTFGAQAVSEAEGLLRSASQLFEAFCLGFATTGVLAWDVEGDAGTVVELHHAATHQLEEFPGMYLLVLSNGHLHGSQDGYAGGRYAVVRHHPKEPDHDVVVVAHELGHLLGLRHHQVSCGCIMDRRGYTKQWGPFHRSILMQASKAHNTLEAVAQAHREGDSDEPCAQQ